MRQRELNSPKVIVISVNEGEMEGGMGGGGWNVIMLKKSARVWGARREALGFPRCCNET